MAEENEDQQDQELEVEVEESGGKKKLLIIIGASIIALALIGAAVWFFLLNDDEEAPSDDTTDEVVEQKGPAIYVGVPEAIISPVKGQSRDRLVQIKMSLLVRSPESEDLVNKHMPRLKNDVLELVADANADEIITPEGRKQLQKECLKTIQTAMQQLEGAEHVEQVLFVSFVMQ